MSIFLTIIIIYFIYTMLQFTEELHLHHIKIKVTLQAKGYIFSASYHKAFSANIILYNFDYKVHTN